MKLNFWRDKQIFRLSRGTYYLREIPANPFRLKHETLPESERLKGVFFFNNCNDPQETESQDRIQVEKEAKLRVKDHPDLSPITIMFYLDEGKFRLLKGRIFDTIPVYNNWKRPLVEKPINHFSELTHCPQITINGSDLSDEVIKLLEIRIGLLNPKGEFEYVSLNEKFGLNPEGGKNPAKEAC